MLQTFAFALLGLGSAHGPLHPAGADLFLEIGSPKDLFAARERAPFNKLFADEEMKKLYGLLEGFKLPVQAIGDTTIPSALFGEASPFRALQHASFSASGVDQFSDVSDMHIGIEGVFDFADPAAATAALAALDGWKAIARCESAELAQECKLGEHSCALRWYEIGGTSLASLAPASGQAGEHAATKPSSPLWFAQDGARLYMGSLENPPERVSARISGKEPGLADESKLFAGTEAMSPSSGTPIYHLWSDIDLQSVLHSPALAGHGEEAQVLARWLLPTLIPYAGAKGVWRVEMRGERFVTEAVYRRHPAFESKAVGNGNTDASAARFVPKEAVGAWVTNIDGPALESEMRALVSALLSKGGDAQADALKDLPPLADGLGTHAAFYLLPINSIQAFLPRAFLAVELKDKTRFETALNAWAAKLVEIDPEAKVVNKPYRKLACVSVSHGKSAEEQAAPSASPLGGLAPDMSLDPTIVVFEDRVLFSLKKSYAQTETRRIADGKSTELHPIANPETFPKDVFEASTMDWGGLVGKLLDIAKGLAPLAAAAMGDKAPQIDASALPGSATLARYFKPTTSWSKRLADGRIYTYAESSFGPETPLEIALFAAAAGPAMKQRAEQEAAHPALPEQEVKTEAVVDQAGIETQSALLLVKTGLVIYKSENAKLPAQLEDLLVPSGNYPDGYLAPQKSVPKDGWGHALVFKPEADGKRFLLYSCGPDGKDDGGAGDDVKSR
jgi:hypothetical protein